MSKSQIGALRAVVAALKPSGAILYRGPSLLTGAPIVVVVTGLQRPSANSKTGDLLQTWILSDGPEAPQDATRSGADAAVCGTCPHGPGAVAAGLPRTCYVQTHNAPRSVWDGVRRGLYPTIEPADLAALLGRNVGVRLGAYGDPAAVPAWVWIELGTAAPLVAGYTHAWRTTPEADALRQLVMASADSLDDAREAWAEGWRTFRVYDPAAGEAPTSGEIDCPSARGVSCESCGLCAGTRAAGRSIAIPVHGAAARAFTSNRRALRVLS